MCFVQSLSCRSSYIVIKYDLLSAHQSIFRGYSAMQNVLLHVTDKWLIDEGK